MSVDRAVDHDLPEHLYRWLEAAQRRMAADLDSVMDDEVRRVGFRRLRVLQLISPGGSRQQELAERATMTKQAIAEFVYALENDGYVERRPDPSDGRAWLIVRTSHGEKLNARLNAAIGAVEFQLARSIGKSRYKAFMDVLRELGENQI